jgi:hypothetical protein
MMLFVKRGRAEIIQRWLIILYDSQLDLESKIATETFQFCGLLNNKRFHLIICNNTVIE